MPDHRYPRVWYSMLKVLDERGRITWASHIRCLLERCMVLVMCGLVKVLVM